MPQSGLGAGSAVLHQGRGMERSAQRQCRKGIRADHPGDVVQGIYRRMASEQDRLYYIKGEEWKKDAVWPPNGEIPQIPHGM